MKRIFLSLLCVAFTGVAYGQSSLPIQPALEPGTIIHLVHEGMLPESAIELVGGTRILSGPFCGPHCGSACHHGFVAPVRTACVSQPTKRIHTKICYSSACGQVCYGSIGRRCDANCAQGQCEGRAYTTKYLIKKVHITVCDAHQCVPGPSCTTGHGILHRHAAPATPAAQPAAGRPTTGGKE